MRTERLYNPPVREEVGGYVNQRLAMELLGISSKSWLADLLQHGDIKAIAIDKRTLLYDKASIKIYLANRPRQARAPRKRVQLPQQEISPPSHAE